MAHIRAMKSMIKTIRTYDESISDRTLWALQQVPREKFIKEKGAGYLDTPLPIGFGQTISQPYIVAYMTDKLNINPLDKVLEIGTGSGYQTAVLAEMAHEIYSVERIFKLSQRTQKILETLGYGHIQLKVGDGYKGWDEKGPFDKIIVTAMSNEIPQLLVDQLKVGGQMIIPYKGKLQLIKKTGTKWLCNCGKSKKYPLCDGTHKGSVYKPSAMPKYDTESLIGVVFVPLVKG
jgi:protein-L-isoaspartate(D-aspartate) O-methyltransferase